ncbi:hypothetical protein AB0N24_20645 [Arthrobacter sp. NPDC093128]|uniref:hypothetical protein n=1 Tax=Arthrobacter sp. NPDC093128 TaxID=3154979 RepID=UPI003423E0A4
MYQRAGPAQALQHLVKLGHTSIAHVSGPQDWIDAAARTDGWRRTPAEAGLPPEVLIQGDWSADMAHGPSAAASVLNPRLVVRASTAAPRR